MKSIFLISTLLISIAANAQTSGNCDITQNSEVIDIVEQEVFKVLTDNGVTIEEGATLDVMTKTPTIYNKRSFGDAFDLWKTDVLVYEMQDWVLEQNNLLNEKVLVYEVQYSSIVTDDDTQKFTCTETGKSTDQIITTIDTVRKM